MRANINYKDLAFFDRFSIEKKDLLNGDLILKNLQTEKLVLVKQLLLKGQQNNTSVITSLRGHCKLSHQWLIPLINYYIIKQSKQHEQKILLLYPQQPKRLSQELLTRQAAKHYYTEKELWELVFTIVCTASYLQQNEVYFDVLSIDDIGISDDSCYKLRNPLPFSPYLSTLRKGNYYSPESLKFFKTGDVSYLKFRKSGVFSLGLCILKITLLERWRKCYIYEKFMVIQTEVRNMLRQIYESYSTLFGKLVESMLCINPRNRPCFTELKERISQCLSKLDLDFSTNWESVNESSQKPQQSITDGIHSLIGFPLPIKQSDYSKSLNFTKIRKTATRQTLHTHNESVKIQSLGTSDLRINYAKSILEKDKQKKSRIHEHGYFIDSLQQQREFLSQEYSLKNSEFLTSRHLGENGFFTDTVLMENLRISVKEILQRKNSVIQRTAKKIV